MRNGLREPVDIGIFLDRDTAGGEAAMDVLRGAKIAQSVRGIFNGALHFEILPAAVVEADALKLATAAGLDMNTTP